MVIRLIVGDTCNPNSTMATCCWPQRKKQGIVNVSSSKVGEQWIFVFFFLSMFKWKLHSAGGTKRKSHRLTNVLGFILWRPWLSNPSDGCWKKFSLDRSDGQMTYPAVHRVTQQVWLKAAPFILLVLISERHLNYMNYFVLCGCFSCSLWSVWTVSSLLFFILLLIIS